MSLLHALILQCLHQLNGDRTIYSVLHLLTGKKSTQTIQDAHLYHQLPLFKTFPKLTRHQYNTFIQELLAESLIQYRHDKHICLVTEKGVHAYKAYFVEHPFPKYIHGWKYQDVAIPMWKKLNLFVQAMSHLNYSMNRYYPIERDRDVTAWVRKKIMTYKGNRKQLSKILHDELYSILSLEEFPEDPFLIVGRFTGFKMIGLTNKQLAEKVEVNEIECYLRFIHCLHFMIQTIQLHKDDFPLMYSLIQTQNQKGPFSASTYNTYQLLQQNLSIKEIANFRGLKESTIEDHIIEIALADREFQIHPYIDEKIAKEIVHVAEKTGNKRLKPLKEQFPNLTYFQLRLALTKSGVLHG